MQDKLLTIQEAGKLLGVSTKTLRRWEARGILIPQRTAGNQRRYIKSQIENFKLQKKFGINTEFNPTPSGQIFQGESRPEGAERAERVDWQENARKATNLVKKGVYVFSLTSLVLIVGVSGLFILGKATNYLEGGEVSNLAHIAQEQRKQVLAAGTEGLNPTLLVNIPSNFFEGIEAQKVATLSGGIITENQDIDAGEGSVFASNLIYGLVAGTGIAIGPGQTPTVSNSGAVSVNESSGELTIAGSGSTTVSTSGTTITISSSDTGLTAEADTLATVTSRGAITSTASTFSGGLTLGTGLTFSDTAGILNLAGGGTLAFKDGSNTLFTVVDSGSYGTIRLSDKGSTGDPATCAAGDIYFNDTDNTVKACTSVNTWEQLDTGGSGGISSLSLAGDSGTTQTITDSDTITIAGGTNGIDTVVGATDTVTLNLNTTEIGATTFGSGSGFTWTFNAGTTDPQITFGDNALTIASAATITLSTFTSSGGPLYTNGSGVLAQVIAGSSTQCLLGGTTPSFGSCAAGGTDSPFQVLSGAIVPLNSTLDFLIGAQATSSAKFAVLNINSGTPTASLSAGTAGGAYLTAAGDLQTTAKQALTIGGDTTGIVKIQNLTDAASNQALIIRGNNRAAAANGDNMYVSYTMMDSAQIEREVGKMTFRFDDRTTNSKNSSFTLETYNANALKDFFHIDTNTDNSGEIVFNEDAQAVDFRVEGNTNANLFFLDASKNAIGVGTNNPLALLDIQGGGWSGDNSALIVNQTGAGDIFTASASGTTRFVISNAGNVGIGDTTPDALLDVETTSAPTLDLVAINDTVGTSTSGVDSLQINLLTAAAAGNRDNAALRLAVNAAGATELGDSYQAIAIDDVTNQTGSGTALKIGSGWDRAIVTEGMTSSSYFGFGTKQTSGEIIRIGTAPTTTLAGDLTAVNIDLFSGWVASNVDIKGLGITMDDINDSDSNQDDFTSILLSGEGRTVTATGGVSNPVWTGTKVILPVSINTDSSATGITLRAYDAVTQTITQTQAEKVTLRGFDLSSAGALVQNTAAGTIDWTGLNINMPAITQTTGTVTSRGINITGGTVTSGTAYALTTDANAGNVGIGTTSPTQKLHVAGGGIRLDNGQNIYWRNSGDSGDQAVLQMSGDTVFLRGGGGTPTIQLAAASGAALTVLEGGNVGIGTATPLSLLHVSGGTAGGRAALIVDQTGAVANDIFTASASGTTRFTLANDGDITLTGGDTITASSLATLTTSGTLALNGASTINTNQSSLTLFNSTATTLNFAGAATTLGIGTTDGVTRAINLGTGTGADTINIGTGGTNADTITLGNTGVASTVAINSGATTQNPVAITANSLTTGRALDISHNGDPGAGEPGPTISYRLLNISDTRSGAYSSVGTESRINIAETRTLSGGNNSNTETTNYFNLTRSSIVDQTIHTFTVAGALARIAASGSIISGNLIDTANILALEQNCGTSVTCNGDVLKITNKGTGNSLSINNGTTTQYVITNGGNIGIGTETPSALLDIQGGNMGGNSALIVNQTGAATNDIFTASASGTTRFTLANDGDITLTGGDTITASSLATFTTAATLGMASTTTLNCGDCIDFDDMEDTLDLDAALTLNQGANTWTQSFTGTTTTGYTYNAIWLTTGKALDINAISTPSTGGSLSGAVTIDLNLDSYSNATTYNGVNIGFLQEAAVAGNTENVVQIRNSDSGNTSDLSVNSLLLLDNADTSSFDDVIVANALLITNTGGLASGIVDAIDASDANIDNAINIGANAIAGTNFSVATTGEITTIFATTGSFTAAACWDGTGASTLRDCVTSVLPDYAEIYPVEAGIEYGELVAIGTSYTTGTQGTNVPILTKSKSAYQNNVLGITSNNYGDFSSTGYEFDDSQNQIPVALNGRVPLKVSTVNGEIKAGDVITSSDTPGVGMKATKAGRVVGMALESFDTDGIGKVLVFVNPHFYDPDVYLADDGSLIVQNQGTEKDPLFTVQNQEQDGLASIVDRIGAFSKVVAANITSGLLNAKKVETDSLSATNSAFLTSSVGDFTAENATVSGTLSADKIKASSIELLNSSINFDTLDEELETINEKIAILAGLGFFNATPLSTNSAFLTIAENLMVSGSTTLTDAAVLNTLSVGNNLTIGSNSIDTLGADLEIQPLGQGGVRFLGGAVSIDVDGKLKVQEDAEFAKNVSVAGVLSAKDIAVSRADVEILSEAEVVASGSSGLVTLSANEPELKINSDRAKASSLIFITPYGETSTPLYIKEQNEGYFVIGIKEEQPVDIKFNFLIVN